MSLPHAILGLLAHEPLTGYDLKRRWFDQALRYFWPADQAQIYRTLDGLLAQGLVDVQVEPGTDRPSRKVYSPTAAGRAELRRWLTTPQLLPTVRDPLLVQLFCAADLAEQELQRLLTGQRAAHQTRLSEYQEILTRLSPLPSSRRQRLWLLTLENGIRREQAYLDWLDAAMAGLDAVDSELGERAGHSRMPDSIHR